MKIKTYRFAAVAAVLLALCLVFMMPVGATDDVAKVGDDTYTNLQEAIKAAAPSGTVDIISDVTVDKWIMFSQRLSIGSGQIITLDMDGLTINGNNHTLTVNSIESASNGNRLFHEADNLTIKDLTINYADGVVGGISLKSGEINNVTFNGGVGVLPGTGKITITSCEFNTTGSAIYNEEDRDNLVVTGNKFNTAAGQYAIYLRGNTTFTDNTVISGKVNVVNGYPVVTDNDFGTERFKVYNGATAKISGNKINNLVFNDASEVKSTFADNILSDEAKSVLTSNTAAKIGETYYTTLADAVEAAKAGDTVTQLKDVVLPAENGVIIIGKSLTLDGNGYSITRPGGNFGIGFRGNTELIQVTLENLNISDINYGVQAESLVDLTIRNSKISSWGALVFYPSSDGSNAAVYNSVLTGTNKNYDPVGTENQGCNDYGTIVFEESNVTLAVTDSTIKAIAESTANQSIIKFSKWNGPNSDNTVTITGGELILEKGNSASVVVYTANDAQNDDLVIGAGVTANFNPSAYIASGYEVVQPGDKYLVQKYVDRSSSSSSSSTTEPEEPEQPEEPVVEPETPAAPGEVTVETEVTDGGEVEFESPVEEPGVEGGSAAADEDEAKITGVVLPTGTDSEVTFVPVSEQPAPAGQEENTKKVFEINVPSYEKGKAAVIKFQMTVEELAADGKEAADVALWHFDEETGEWTKLVTSYTIVDGVVYFEAITNDFSPFAIIYEDEPVDEPVEEPETPASPAPVLGLLAALGAAVVLRRK